MASLSTPLTLPVLPLDDEVVLPGMVVPLDLSDTDVRAAVEAAQAAARSDGGKPRVLLVPRVDGTYAGIGTLGTVEQVGRLSDGDPGALIRGVRRVRVGAGTTGPGAALWIEGTTVEEIVPDPLPGAVTELMKEYKALATSWLRKRGAGTRGARADPDPVPAADDGAGVAVGQPADLLDRTEGADAGVGAVDTGHQQHAGLPGAGPRGSRVRGLGGLDGGADLAVGQVERYDHAGQDDFAVQRQDGEGEVGTLRLEGHDRSLSKQLEYTPLNVLWLASVPAAPFALSDHRLPARAAHAHPGTPPGRGGPSVSARVRPQGRWGHPQPPDWGRNRATSPPPAGGPETAATAPPGR